MWRDRNGNPVTGDEGQDRLLEWLYGTKPGQIITGLLVKPAVSRAAGWLLDCSLSQLAVAPFQKKTGIDMTDFAKRKYHSFNDFFTRELAPGARPIDLIPEHLIAPCDSKLSVYPIAEDSRFFIKGRSYTMGELLRDDALAEKFRGGTLLLFRLTVGDYHRYSYIDSGFVGGSRKIPGFYHTVNPAAASRISIYKENTREYSLLESDHFGTVLQMEVGATMVGRIVNETGNRRICRGEEKGRFEFGGSTVIVCLEKGKALLDDDLIRNTRNADETVVRLGEKIGTALL